MAYERQNFEDGNVLSAAALNHIEDGLVEIETTGIKIVKLWENASPSSSFPAQTISGVFDSTTESFDFVMVSFNRTTSNLRKHVAFSPIGWYSEMILTANIETSDYTVLHAMRRFVLTRTGDFTVGSTYLRQSTSTASDTYLVPSAIYGIKGVQ